PLTSVTVSPATPASPSASRTSSSLNGRMIAMISFMERLLWRGLGRSERHRQRYQHGVVEAGEVGVVPFGADGESVLEALAAGELPVVVVQVAAVAADPLPAVARADAPAALELPARAQVERRAAVGVGDAEQVGGGIGILRAEHVPVQAEVQLERVRRSEERRVGTERRSRGSTEDEERTVGVSAT